MSPALVSAMLRAPGRVPMPTWIGYASAGLVLVMTVVGVWLMVRSIRGWDPGEGEGGGDGGGRGGGGGPKVPRGPSPKSDPDWWPEFERAFAAYASGRRSARAEREVGPSRAGTPAR